MNLRLYSSVILRLLCLFVAGVAASRWVSEERWLTVAYCAVGIAALALLVLVWLQRHRRFSSRSLTGWCFGVLMACLGLAYSCYEWQQRQSAVPSGEQWWKAEIVRQPERTRNSFACHVKLIGDNGAALVYLNANNADTAMLAVGRVIAFRGVLLPVRNYGNPDEFDYRTYMLLRGIGVSGYAVKWRATNVVSEQSPITAFAQRSRQRLLQLYTRYPVLSDSDYGLLAALTLGDRESLTEEQRNDYRQAGVAHILVVSGLHVGIVYGVLLLLVSLLCPYRGFYAKRIVCVVGVWGFALLTGMMPSVLRATIAITALVAAQVLSIRTRPMNTLAVVGFLLLLYEPLWLFDVGFQLSFAAVGGIVLWYEWMAGLWHTENRVLRYLNRLIAVSVSAQLGVLPLVLCYFSSFPLYFLLGNILLVGLSGVLIGVSMVFLMFAGWWEMMAAWLATVLHYGVAVQEGIIAWISRLPYSSIGNIYLPFWEAVLLAVFIAVSMECLRRYTDSKRVPLKVLLCSLASLFVCEAIKAFADKQPESGVYVYALPSSPALQVFEAGERSYLWTQEGSDSSRIVRALQPYWNRIRLQPLPPAIYSTSWQQSVLYANGITIYRVSDDRQAASVLPLGTVPTHLWLLKGYRQTIADLCLPEEPQQVILDASLSDYYRRLFAEECKALKIPVIDIRRTGAVLLSANTH